MSCYRVMLLHEAPICQSVEEKQNILTQNKGRFDVVFSYQIALGTIGKYPGNSITLLQKCSSWYTVYYSIFININIEK